MWTALIAAIGWILGGWAFWDRHRIKKELKQMKDKMECSRPEFTMRDRGNGWFAGVDMLHTKCEAKGQRVYPDPDKE